MFASILLPKKPQFPDTISDQQRPLWPHTLIVPDDGEEPLFCALMRLAAVNQG